MLALKLPRHVPIETSTGQASPQHELNAEMQNFGKTNSYEVQSSDFDYDDLPPVTA